MKRFMIRSICLSLMSVMLAGLLTLPAIGADTTVDGYAPDGYVNVARGATVSVSNASSKASGENSYEMPSEKWCKAMLVDGDLNTGWSTNPYDVETDKNKPVVLTLDLGEVTEIARVVLFPTGSGKNFPVTYSVLTSLDGSNYTEQLTSAGNPGVNHSDKVHDFSPTSARYVQIKVTERYAVESAGAAQSSDGLLVQLGEVAVYGKAVQKAVLDKHALQLLPGEEADLTLTLSGFASTPAVSWSSDNTAVATVSKGKVTAKGTGTAKITATVGAVVETCTVRVVKEKRGYDENIMISIFWPPTKEYINDEQYQLMADASITYVMGSGDALGAKDTQEKMLALCDKYGMQMTVGDDRLGRNLIGMSEQQILDVVNEYKSVPGVGGYYMLDEPYNPNVFIDAYRVLKSAEPDKYMHLNFLPSASYPSLETYISQMNDWCRLCASTGYPLDYLMYDRYPYGVAAGSMDRVGFLANMDACHDVGLENDVKTGAYIQSICIPGGFRRPTDSEIRYEIYMYLAYGYKQISYFTWFTPVNRSEPFEDGIISPTGQPNAHYAAISEINREVLALGKVLIGCDALEIYLNGETWGQESIPKDFPVQPDDSKNYTVSLLKHRETGRNYIMVVNNNFSRKQNVSLLLDDSITSLQSVSKTDGSLESVSLSGGKLSLTLRAGDGVLLALPEGLDYAKQITRAPIGSNLAADAGITCDSSTGTSDQYMDNLNDGNRKAESSGTGGWVADGVEQAEIVIDIGYQTNLNRVDIYPAGSGSQAAKNFGKSICISVSGDGKSWTEVIAKTDVNAREAIPSFTFDQQTARYVKLELSAKGQKIALAEIEVFMDDGSVGEAGTDLPRDEVIYTQGMNIALNRPFEVSSQTGDEYVAWGWAGKFINDGNLTNGWTSNVKRNDKAESTEYVLIDFGDLFAVDRVVVHAVSDLWPEDFEILLSRDGESWTSIDKQVGSKKPGAPYEVTLSDSIPATMVKLVATKLRSTAADGYMLQLAEIEAYGTPICDKSALQAIMDEYVAAGGDVTAPEYVEAQAGMENPLLTSSSMSRLIRTLRAAFPEQETTSPPQSEPSAAPDTTLPDGQTAELPEQNGGCKSAAGAAVLLAMAAAFVAIKKKK